MIYQLTLVALALLIGNGAAEVNICSNVVDYLFLPHISNCSEYYLCVGNVSVPRECPTGYYFDARDQECVVVEEVRCLPTCPSNGISTFSYDRTCTKFVLCYGGVPVLQQCSDGLQYNPATDRCDYPQYVDCVDNLCVKPNDASAIVYIASKARCNKYYVCESGIPQNMTCSSGLQYNSKTEQCDFPSKVNCTVETLERNIQPFAKAPPRSADISCPSEGVQFFAHKNRDDAYYYCVNGRGITLECTPGLVYDPKRQECREPQFVNT